MECPFCQSAETDIVSTDETLGALKRRRQCQSCLMHFVTYEKVHTARAVQVVKKDGSLEPFSAEKLERSVSLAFFKRKLTPRELDSVVADIISAVQREQPSALTTGKIVLKAAEILKYADRVAWLRYVIMNRQYEDTLALIQVLKTLDTEGDGSAEGSQTRMGFKAKSKRELKEVF